MHFVMRRLGGAACLAAFVTASSLLAAGAEAPKKTAKSARSSNLPGCTSR